MASDTNNKSCFEWKYQNRQLHITLEFPEHPDLQAENQFITGLKEICLRRVKEGAMQKEKENIPDD